MSLKRSEVVSGLFQAIRAGEPGAQDRLLEAVYTELRGIASHKMAGERANHTLQPTALVNEAWFRLFGGEHPDKWGNRAYFFKAAAESMRKVLVDHARAKQAKKRPHDSVRVTLDDNLACQDPGILAVDEALTKLEGESRRLAQIVKLRYFSGLTITETARVLDVSPSTIDKDWHYARAWLKREISRQPETNP